ncbi:glycosyltransferase family 2 protein [Romboutsia sp.]|uniref:glycosyltransferase family 2 protein n=1 Tax=Romboutsia sp. TaxID=1965302 RepID=UPI003F3F4BFD
MKTISLCMITQNNERTLERALNSVSSLVNEIIIVDTGSSDKTIEIAKKFNSKIYHFIWCNDFSKARNFALDKATMEWILVLDSDEYIEQTTAIRIRNNIETKNFKAYTMLINNINKKYTHENSHPLTKLFINDKDIRYEHRIHEQIDWSFFEKYQPEDFCYSDMLVMHDGYDETIIDANKKSKRNLDILLSYTEKEKDGYYYYLLGKVYFYDTKFEMALSNFKKALDDTDKIIGQLKDLFLKKLHCLYKLGYYKQTLKEIDDCLIEEHNFRELYYLKFLILKDCGFVTDCIENLKIFGKIDNNFVSYPILYAVSDKDILWTINKYSNYMINEKCIKNITLMYVCKELNYNNLKSSLINYMDLVKDIIVVTPINKINDLKLIEEIPNVKSVGCNNSNDDNMIFNGLNYLNNDCDYILLGYDGELVSKDTCDYISHTLNNSNVDGITFNLTLLNKNNFIPINILQYSTLRLFKRSTFNISYLFKATNNLNIIESQYEINI